MLYNAALEQRRGVWRWERRSVSRFDQFGELTGWDRLTGRRLQQPLACPHAHERTVRKGCDRPRPRARDDSNNPDKGVRSINRRALTRWSLSIRLAPMAAGSLTPTSYVVLGLVGYLGSCTSYDLKQTVARSIGYFWSFPHSQLYAEPARLVSAGLLVEEREVAGRRRRRYRLTPRGTEALQAWLARPTEAPTEIRDLALLKLFFGGQGSPENVARQAETALATHRQRLAEYEAIAVRAPTDAHQRRTLDLGLAYERAVIAFWQSVAADPPG